MLASDSPNNFARVSKATYFPRVRVVDPDSAYHGELVDLLIEGGATVLSPQDIPDGVERVEVEGLCVSPGWVDVGGAFHEPGHEEKETVASFLAAAAVGGYTRVLAYPVTEPAVDDGGDVRAVSSLADEHVGVDLALIGALSMGLRGEQLSTMGELSEAGVAFFGDGLRAVGDAKLLQLALTYAQGFDGTVISQPGERRLEGAGQMHEGRVSTALGLPGLPAIAEEIGVARDLALRSYRGGRLHFHALSLASTVAQAAEHAAAELTFGVSALHLLATDEALINYDVNVKVLPPLRGEEDRAALQAALRSGAASVLTSNHRPEDLESTRVEFPYAAFGAATIELTYALATTAVGSDVAVDYLSRRNRAFAKLPAATLQAGATAELTFFVPDAEFTVPPETLASRAVNVPLVGTRLRGLPIGTYARGAWRPSAWADYLTPKP